MTDPKDKLHTQPDANKPPHSGEQERSGRATFDDRGNAIWEWKTEEGDYDPHANTQRIKKLAAKELEIMDEPPAPTGKKGLSQSTPTRMPDGGVNPYNAPVAPKKKEATCLPPLVRQSPTPAPSYKPEPEKPKGMWNKLKQKFFDS